MSPMIGGAAHSPVLEHHPRHDAEPLQRQVAAREGELAPGDVPTFRQPRLAKLERAEHEEVRVLVEPLLTQADPVHDAIAKGQLGHCC